MRSTKLNHLVEKRHRKDTCNQTGKQHHWVACGEPRASAGGNMFVNLRCQRCNANTVVLLSAGEYEMQKRIINNSVKEQESL
jgi:hypothetical protein